jgi:kynurenine formamidase
MKHRRDCAGRKELSTVGRLVALVILGIGLGLAASAQTSNAEVGRSSWGASDEIGTLNMMSDSSRLVALQRITSGRVYDLGVDLFVGMPSCCTDWGDPPYQIWMTHTPPRGPNKGQVTHSSDGFSMSIHTGTHLDTLNHFGLEGKIWNGVRADEGVRDRGWTKSGADKYPPIVARGVLLDVAASKGTAQLPASYAVTVADLQEALTRQRSRLLPGDVVLLRTGLMTLWPDSSKLRLANQSGLSLEAARWLVEEQKAMLVGADNFGVERFPSTSASNFAPVHTYLLAERGVSMLELLWLEDLSRDRVYQFVFVASPLKLRGATGSPVRPIAIPIRQ